MLNNVEEVGRFCSFRIEKKKNNLVQKLLTNRPQKEVHSLQTETVLGVFCN